MVTIDYDIILNWMKEKNITRRQLCKNTGIPEGTFYSALQRKSKMQVAYVWQIADYMGVRPIELLSRDDNGNVDQDEFERIQFGRTEYEISVENEKIQNIIGLLKGLNSGGLDEAGKMIGLLWEIPRFRKEANEYYDGSAEYWKNHPYQKTVKPYQEGEATDGND